MRMAIAAGLLGLTMAAAEVSPAAAQNLLDSYVAVLGPQDRVNSRGVPLTTPSAIIRQDRANYHRFGRRDPGDQGDSFFAAVANRAVLESWIAAGELSPADARRITGGIVRIRVEIYGSGTTGRSMKIAVLP